MSVLPSQAGPRHPDKNLPQTPRPGGRAAALARRVRHALLLVVIAGALAFAGGFFWFVARVPAEEISLDRQADGIVVLTGGAARIADAIELLASGHGRRLLISGVYRATSASELARLVPRYGQWLVCCVDLDHSAVNTVGNAVETRRWVGDRGFRSLIVVTSSYHMPRTMSELARQMPDVALVPFPVVTDKMRTEPWWSSVATARLLFIEYLKYIVAQARMRLEAHPASAGLGGEREATKR